MYLYQIDSDENYVVVEVEVPMIFIQAEYYDDFNEEFSDKNKTALNNQDVMLEVTPEDLAAINFGYAEVLPVYDTLKDIVSKEYIINYCKINSN